MSATANAARRGQVRRTVLSTASVVAASLGTWASRWLPSSRSTRARQSEPRYCTSRSTPVTDDLAVTRRRAVEPDPLGTQRVGGVDAEKSLGLLGRQHVRRADERRHERRLRRLVDLARRADLLQPAVVEHGDPIAHRQRLALVVGDEHERDPDVALQRLQLDLHLLAQLEVEGAERLVEEQHLGMVDEGPGEGDALALTAAELVRSAVGETRTGGPLRAAHRRAGGARPCARL